MTSESSLIEMASFFFGKCTNGCDKKVSSGSGIPELESFFPSTLSRLLFLRVGFKDESFGIILYIQLHIQSISFISDHVPAGLHFPFP
jgi:hypothetical protein